ncbi:hypothetical protein BX600DRAFT_477571 [Xylariales sp. PMI_506]|nr:hypothetical protein BX600DRAFT_477571 [Xylariales sp. PMI_506]
MGSGVDQAFACQSCRQKHLRCEVDAERAAEPGAELPPCARCTMLEKPCVRTTELRIKLFPSPGPEQHWVRLPRRLYFVNETEEIKALYTLSVGTTYYPYTPTTSVDISTHGDSSKRCRQDKHAEPAPDTPSARTVGSSHTVSDRALWTSLPSHSKVGLCNSRGLGDAAVAFPLRRTNEVRLMKYYLEYMCNWFDLCDVQRHFARELPRLAITSPTLLNAIFALSSRHMSQNEQFDQYAADWYHQECLKHLSTIHMDASALARDDLLAATILLRTLEEMDVPLMGADHEGHLHGIQLFMNTEGAPATASKLRQACFWIGLRQEIVMAFANQRPVKIKLNHDFIDRSFGPADDDTWANRIILHCAEVINFCFGNDPHNTAIYQYLKDYDETWLRSRPLSFLPLAYCEPDRSVGEVFPQILHLNHAVVIGNSHAYFARALLICYDPTVPKIGPGQKLARQRNEAEIRSHIRELCATALSNRATIPAMFTASMGVTMCGDMFVEEMERRAFLDVLVKTESIHSWPTRGAQDHLKKAWGWSDEG